MIWIDAPYFYAGVELEERKVIRAAPIIKWMIGKWDYQVINYCRKKNWKFGYV